MEVAHPSKFRKAAPPSLGPAFNHTNLSDANLMAGLPGSTSMMFDVSKLTTADFRSMRWHPQVNASLSMIGFMLHQMDWSIESEDKRLAGIVEENMRLIWTRLVRAITQAFWAGYSPCVLEWENTPDGNHTFITKVKDMYPEECQVNWKEVESSYKPPMMEGGFGYNQIVPKVKVFDGIKKYGLGYPIPVDHSFWYPIMMENGDYSGRKLLKAAFQPWYFSLLMHLYSNRYFERFGEPVPIGRAPFDDDFPVKQADGTTKVITGKQAMEGILMQLRSRGIVVLPSDRDPTASTGGGRSEYEYDIEYLESQMRGADFERYLARLDEEISLSIFTPMLLMRTGSVGSLNLGVQHTQCVAPETPILCADLVWRPAGTLRVGQEIVAFDEDAQMGQGRGVNARSYRTAVIEGNALGSKPSMRLTTDIGDPITASIDHPWLVWRNRTKSEHGCRTKGLVWVETKDLVVGDKIAHLARPWQQDETFEAGWLSGMFDGEGSLTRNKNNGDGLELTISQVHGPVFDRLKQTMSDLGFQFSASDRNADNSALGVKPQGSIRVAGGFLSVIEMLGRLQPTRLTQNAAERLWEGRGVRQGQSYELATVTSIEDVGMNPIASIKTSSGTFITGGYLSHNTWLWALNSLAGDIKEYIDRYIVDRIKAVNVSPNAAKVEWVPKKMGKENVETLRAIISQLIGGNKATVDLDELGTALGLTLKEVKELQQAPMAGVTEDPNAPAVDDRDRSERVRTGSGRPRGVGEPLATGRQIAARIREQASKQFNSKTFGKADLSMGFRRRFIESLEAEGFDNAEQATDQLYTKMESWLKTASVLGVEEFTGADDFVELFQRRLTTEIQNLGLPGE